MGPRMRDEGRANPMAGLRGMCGGGCSAIRRDTPHGARWLIRGLVATTRAGWAKMQSAESAGGVPEV